MEQDRIEEETIESRLAAREARKLVAKAKADAFYNSMVLELDEIETSGKWDEDKITGVFTTEGLVVVTSPGQAEVDLFRATQWSGKDNLAGGQAKADATKRIARTSVVHPTKQAYDAMVKKAPGIPEPVAVAALKLAGFEEVEARKK